jgi:hypothetical protein
MAVFIFIVPVDLFYLIIKIGLGVFSLFGAVSIFLSWKRKLRMIDVLMKRNQNGFNEESFLSYMDAFCTQLVVLYVLYKIGHLDKFKKMFSDSLSK